MQESLFEPSGQEAGRASFYLIASTLGLLMRARIFTSEQGAFAAAMAAYVARGNGHEEAARLIEDTIDGSRNIDLKSEAQKFGISIEKAVVQ